MLLLDPHIEPANLSLLLVLTSAVAALWLPRIATLIASVIALMAFNWTFVAPRGTFSVDLPQDTLLLAVMFIVNIIVASLVVSLREQSLQAQRHANAANLLRAWGERLRYVDDPGDLLDELQIQLRELSKTPIVIYRTTQLAETIDISNDQRDALNYCATNNQALGPGTGSYQQLPNIFLPLRGQHLTTAVAILDKASADDVEAFMLTQALCDLMGIALENHHRMEQERTAQSKAKAHELRTTFLAAISHDYRTPLATIIGAASALQQQDAQLTQLQRHQLASSIVDEANRLHRQTHNILQLARLDSVCVIQKNWESIEEIVGSVLHHWRDHPAFHLFHINVAPDLPLIKGDALLLAQLLENLIDNAVKYGPLGQQITISARAIEDEVIMTVSDTGATLSADTNYQAINQLFEIFQRGDHHNRNGSGIGLALCRAIAIAHGGNLLLVTNTDGTHFECHLPVGPQPTFVDCENGAR